MVVVASPHAIEHVCVSAPGSAIETLAVTGAASGCGPAESVSVGVGATFATVIVALSAAD